MSVYRRKSGRWAVRVDTERDANGHRTRKNLGTFATKKAAESAERKALEAVERGVDLDAKTTSLGKVVDRFLRDAGTRLSPTTAHRYAELLRLHAATRLGSIPVGRLRAAHIAVPYADLLSQNRTTRRYRVQEAPLSARTVHSVLEGRDTGKHPVLQSWRYFECYEGSHSPP